MKMKQVKISFFLKVCLFVSLVSRHYFFENFKNSTCNTNIAILEFSKKQEINPYPNFNINPYEIQDEITLNFIKKILNEINLVCAIKYEDNEKQKYLIKNFSSKEEAEKNNFIVTHLGPCGACSTLKDLSIYLKEGLTSPVRRCGILGIISKKLVIKCLRKIGFTDACSQIWLYNTINTRKNCFWICIYSWLKREPNTKPDGSLNECLKCDEDKSGLIFKYFSGRTRRNSGIHSEIHRPDEQIYNITHCYF
jgi:hypothetical protein